MTDAWSEARAVLFAEVAAIDDGAPSIGAIYDLDPFLVYADFWLDVRARLRDRWTAPDVRERWRLALMAPPPDDAFWIHVFDRNRGGKSGLIEAAGEWRARPPDRMFDAHHHISSSVDGVAALHVMLLFDLDPVAAVELVAARSSEYLIWAGAGTLELGRDADLIDRVLRFSQSRDAVLLTLACALDRQIHDVKRRFNAIRSQDIGGNAARAAQDALDVEVEETLRPRYHEIAEILAARPDVGAVLGPWLRFLVRSVDLDADVERSQRPALARMALDAACDVAVGLELEKSLSSSVPCLVSRSVLGNGSVEERWREWTTLALGEGESLMRSGELSWTVAGDTLAHLVDPLGAWRDLVRRLQPLLRRRARHGGWEHDDVMFPVVMIGIGAVARLGAVGRTLLEDIYEVALRHFLVAMPPETHRSFQLPAYVFAACPFAGFARSEMEAMLARLPLDTHVLLARRQLKGYVGRSSHEEISVRAYFLWLQRGGHGAPDAAVEDWLAAERA